MTQETQSIIVYRNEREKAIDQFFTSSDGFIFAIAIIGGILSLLICSSIKPLYNLLNKFPWLIIVIFLFGAYGSYKFIEI